MGHIHLRWHTLMCAIVCLCMLALVPGFTKAQCDCDAYPPPAPDETIVTVSSTAEVQNAIANASGRTTIYLAAGVYPVTNASLINIFKPNITLRSLSGNRDDVIIQGAGMDAPGVGHGIYIDADDVTIADLTVRDVPNHGFFINPGSDNCTFYNVRGVDCGEQILKASGYTNEPPKNNGVIRCSTFEYTTVLDDGDDGWYTNGIDLLNCHDWVISDNIIRNIKHNPAITSTLAGPAILLWHGSSNTIVERNRIIECDFGISFGNAGQNGVSHTGGIIRNNFIVGYDQSDFAIGLIYAPGAKVLHNTVYSPGGWGWSIEARFSETVDCLIQNNLCDEPVWQDRDGAAATAVSNITTATEADFLHAAIGDLHLNPLSSALSAGVPVADRTMDIDCESISDPPDIGADQVHIDIAVNDLQELPSAISVYPNPAGNILTVIGYDIDEIRIVDMLGRTVVERHAGSTRTDVTLENLRPGSYLVVAQGKQRIHSTIIQVIAD